MTTQSAKGLRFSKLAGFDENSYFAKWGAGDGRCENHLYTFICNLRGEPDVCICLATSWSPTSHGIHGIRTTATFSIAESSLPSMIVTSW